MRIYEIAKLLDVTNKDIMDFLTAHNILVKSHMSALDEDQVNMLKEHFSNNDKKNISNITEVMQADQVLEAKESRVTTQPEKETVLTADVKQVLLLEPMTLGQLAEKIKKPVSEIIMLLLRNNIMCAKNQLLPEKAIYIVAEAYQFSVERKDAFGDKKAQHKDISAIKHTKEGSQRAPIVVVLGHVDHGKTTLLDFVRKTKVVEKEKGGITQHLGAYRASTNHGPVVFLDTPGHDAFSNIRGRGVNVADIAVLVVAADDGIMPQTVDALEKAQAAKLPIIVAINKMDKADIGRIEAVKREFIKYDLLPEEWGGTTIFVPISAKNGTGVDQLLEMILLQSEMMELRADDSKDALGFILESKIEKGLGFVATVLCQQGLLHVGDYFAVGNIPGKVISITDSFGKRLQSVGASVPVQISGFSELPTAGDYFQVISVEKYKALKSAKSSDQQDVERKQLISEDAFRVIVKADNSSSREALVDSLQKLFKKLDKKLCIVSEGVGDILESDIISAITAKAVVLGLHVKIDPNAEHIAEKNMIKMISSGIIYKITEEVELLIKSKEPVKMVMKKIGEAVVRKVFAVKNIGQIAGSYVKDGRFVREGKVIAWRGKERLGEGYIKSLERDRKSVKEVHSGFEFAFFTDGITDWQIDDRVECYIEIPQIKA